MLNLCEHLPCSAQTLNSCNDPPAMAFVYKVVAVNNGKVQEVIKEYDTYKLALAFLQKMNSRHYHNDLGDTFAILIERV